MFAFGYGAVSALHIAQGFPGEICWIYGSKKPLSYHIALGKAKTAGNESVYIILKNSLPVYASEILIPFRALVSLTHYYGCGLLSCSWKLLCPPNSEKIWQPQRAERVKPSSTALGQLLGDPCWFCPPGTRQNLYFQTAVIWNKSNVPFFKKIYLCWLGFILKISQYWHLIKIISLKAKLKYYEPSNHCQLLVATLNRFSPWPAVPNLVSRWKYICFDIWHK